MKKEIPPEIEDFSQKAIPILKKYGLIKNRANFFLIIVIFILGILSLSLLLYAVKIEAFKSSINQSVELIPETTIDVHNQYDNKYEPLTENKFENNFTILLPDNLCNCNCG